MRGSSKLGFVVAFAAAGLISIQSGAAAEPPDWAGGQAAVDRLGVRLPAVAAANGLSSVELRTHLLTDFSLFLDRDDRLVYVDPMRAESTTEPAPTVAESTTDAFALNSRPGATRVIYVDFDGHLVAGTRWNSSMGGDCYADAYDTDGAPSTFSDTERGVIRSVWARVAEDYAGLNVNVTTADPGFDAINRSSLSDPSFGTRAVIANSKSACPNGKTVYTSVCSGGCGGVAYVGVFDEVGTNHTSYQPAFVFQNGVGGGAKNLAEATSHEVGHNLGLSHDGSRTTSYYEGHGSWAPIMGVGYYKAITQWSRGEYTGANNTQDDFAVMQTNGAPALGDDHTAPATALAAGTPARGIIEAPIDTDSFSFTVADGATVKATLDATPAATSPNLDIELRLTGPGVDVSSDPPSGSTGDVATGMGSTITATLTAGAYTVTVDGGGDGDPKSTGYSDYASVGAFTVTLTTSPADPSTPPPAAITLTARAYKIKSQKYADLSWNTTAGATYRLLRNGNVIATGITNGTYTDGPLGKGSGTASYQVCTTTNTDVATCSNTATVTW